MNATAATATQVITGTHPCACGGYVAKDAAGRETRTACNAVTKRTFAPGHDARLKGFLIRAGVEGLLISTPEGGAEQSPERVADRFGFGKMVTEGVNRGKAREWAKATKVAAKPAPKVAAPVTVTAKVGRWEYRGVILAAGDGSPVFRYTNAKGVTTDTMKFTQIG